MGKMKEKNLKSPEEGIPGDLHNISDTF